MNAPTATRPARTRYAEIDLPMKGIRARLVRGSITKLQTKDNRQQLLEERRHHWFSAYAVPKSTPGIADAINALFGHAWTSYSAVAGSQPVLQQIGLGFGASAFAWGVTDADLDAKWAAREGCAGCYIFKTRRNIALGPVPCFAAGAHGPGTYLTIDPATIGLGDYVEVSLVASINGEVGSTAGMFVQPAGLLWLETGERIVAGGRSAQDMFGTGPRPAAALPLATSAPVQHQPAAPASVAAYQAPGMAGPAPGQHIPAPPPPPAPVEPAETVAARHGVPHHHGYRFNPAAWAYEPDVAPNAPAAAPAAPAPAQYTQGAPSVAAGGPQVTASPSNPYGPGNPPPGAVPNYGFVGGGHTPAPAGGPPRVG